VFDRYQSVRRVISVLNADDRARCNALRDRWGSEPCAQAGDDASSRTCKSASGVWICGLCFFFSSRRRHTILVSDWSSDVCSSDLPLEPFKSVKNSSSGSFFTDLNGSRGCVGSIFTKVAMAPMSFLMFKNAPAIARSEERRVGKECKSRWWASD